MGVFEMNRNDSSVMDKLYDIDCMVEATKDALSEAAADSWRSCIEMAKVLGNAGVNDGAECDSKDMELYRDSLSFAACATGVEYLAQCAAWGLKSLYRDNMYNELSERWDIVQDVFARSREEADKLRPEGLSAEIDYCGVSDIEGAYDAAVECKDAMMKVLNVGERFSERAAAAMEAAARWAAIASWSVDENALPLERQSGFWENAA